MSINYFKEYYKAFGNNLELKIKNAPGNTLKKLKAKKDVITTDKWNSIENKAHLKAFTVAGVMKADLLQEMYNYVEKGIKEGWSFDTFKKKVSEGDLLKRMSEAGWTGRNKETGNVNASRLQVIYDTNLKMASAQGKFERLKLISDKKPYWEYNQVERNTKRKEHAQFHKKKFRFDDPIWNTIYPPGGFRCACYVTATDDATGLENGYDYIDNIDRKEFPISPLEAFTPDTDKYVAKIGKQLTAMLKEKEAIIKSKAVVGAVAEKTNEMPKDMDFDKLQSYKISDGTIDDYDNEGWFYDNFDNYSNLMKNRLGYVPSPKMLKSVFLSENLHDNLNCSITMLTKDSFSLIMESGQARIRRVINLKTNTVDHALLVIGKSVRNNNQGVAQMMANQLAFYKELGINKIEVHANIDVGCYTWSQYGFKFKNQEANEVFYSNATRNYTIQNLNEAEKKCLKECENNKLEVYELVEYFKKQNLDARKILINNQLDWYGVLDLKDKDSKQRALKRIYEKLKK